MNEWLNGLVHWTEGLTLHETMATVSWAVPFVQTVHILAIAVVFGSSLMLALRTLRLAGTDWSPARWGQRLNAWVGWGLLVLLVSGALMICGEPGRSLLNFTFQIKMVLLVVAMILFVLLARGLRAFDAAEAGTSTPVRALALLLILTWLAIIVCGRWIAYT